MTEKREHCGLSGFRFITTRMTEMEWQFRMEADIQVIVSFVVKVQQRTGSYYVSVNRLH